MNKSQQMLTSKDLGRMKKEEIDGYVNKVKCGQYKVRDGHSCKSRTPNPATRI